MHARSAEPGGASVHGLSAALLLLLIALAAPPALASPGRVPGAPSTPSKLGARVQEAGAPAGSEEASEEATGPVYPSPRAVLATFLEAMREGDAARAASTFEQGAFLSQAAAEEAARTLYQDVFLHTRRISVGKEVPGAEHPKEPYVLELSPESDPGRVARIEIVPIQDGDEGFRISAGTLDDLPRLVSLLADVELSEDVLADFSLLEALRHRLRSSLPEALLGRAFLLENWQWLGLAVLVFLSVVIDRLVRWVSGRVAARLARGENVRLDVDVLLSFERPLGMLVGVLAFEHLLPALGLDPGVLGVLRLATSFVAAVAGVWAAYRLVDVFGDFMREKAARTRNRFDDMLVPLARRTLKIFVVVVGIVFVASRLSDDLWGIVAGLGIGSIAVGFAARDSIENLFGTFTVLLDKPFQIGDWILVEALEGTVEAVGFRSTRIRTFHDSIVTVPNREFIASAIDNMGERRHRRIKATLGLTYDTPPETIEAFCEGVREIIRSHPYTRKDSYHVYLNGFGESSLDVLLYCFVAVPDWSTELREKHRLFADILRLAESLGVSFAFPTRMVHLARPGDLEHPDRPAGDVEGARLGGRAASTVVEKSLSAFGGVGARPEPVRIEQRPLHRSSDGPRAEER